MPQNSFLLPDKMRIHRFIALAVAMAFVRVIECNVIDNSVIERLTKQSVTSINYLGEAGQKSHLTNAIHFVKQQSNKFDAINENIAKNVIMFLGDGMSVPVLAATRVYMGGEKESLSFEKFPFVAMSKTYCVNQMIADSACSATAYLSGVKGNARTIGVNAKVPVGHCTAELDPATHTRSIAQWAIESGKSIGLVTTTRVTHASPAGVYAHTAHRDWESNADIGRISKCNDIQIDDIAKQLVYGETGSKLKVIFGGGRSNFIDKSKVDENGNPGRRTDRRDLIKEWLGRGEKGENRHYIRNKAGLLSIQPKENDTYLGLFASSHMDFNYKVNGISDEIPTLSEMAMKAIEILSQNPKGFFLFVEGGRIDHGLHETRARIAIDEAAEFSRTIDMVTKMVDLKESLLVVTADHSHTMTLSGYPDRGSNIFGIGDRGDLDFLPYLKLTFANGPGYYRHHSNSSDPRPNPSKMDDLTQFKFQSPTTVPAVDESHGGDDVIIYATGPHSHLFTGSMEQNVIPHLMAYAACIGNGLTACNLSQPN